MKLPMMPRNLSRVADNEVFSFACHNNVRCFTHCCRHLELALTPYDVLRLKNALKLHSREFLDRYVIIEMDEEDAFPRYYLTMVDDGNASCVFVTSTGCSVYQDRPGACRAYPMGRASMRRENDTLEEFYVLLKEDHCNGFEEKTSQTPLQYCRDQELDRYNEKNDALIGIQQHENIRRGQHLSPEQSKLYTLALYDLDTFRAKLFAGELATPEPLSTPHLKELNKDENLLEFGITWLQSVLFPSSKLK